MQELPNYVRPKKLSQQKFAYEADLERSFLSHIEKGRKNISVDTLQRILDGLDIPIKDFFDWEIFKNGKRKGK